MGVVNFNTGFRETRRLEEKNGNFYQFDSILLTGKVDTCTGERICLVGAPATSGGCPVSFFAAPQHCYEVHH
ncbi:MAG TPA: hypothetical protein DEF45_03440 [Rhodopirellula sp.]|nr:hypothetical protein [Rhodopirellula sp.]